MNDKSKLEQLYSQVRKEYSLSTKDTHIERFKKLISALKIGNFQKKEYIRGLEQLVKELKSKICYLETKVAEMKKK